jgi:cytochrome c oxidase assembly protein subunit 15
MRISSSSASRSRRRRSFTYRSSPAWDAAIVIHFTHRVGALFVTVMALATTLHVFAHQRDRGELVRPSILLLVLIGVQITLGAYVIWSGKQFVINSLHVATGASVLATSLVLTLRAHRARFAVPTTTHARVAA